MPNSANKSNSGGKGGPQHRTSRDHTQESNRAFRPETRRSSERPKVIQADSNQGRKAASGGNIED